MSVMEGIYLRPEKQILGQHILHKVDEAISKPFIYRINHSEILHLA